MAKDEGIAPSYMTRVMRMRLLAPEIVEAIVEERQGQQVTLAKLLEPFAAEWVSQQHLSRSVIIMLSAEFPEKSFLL